MALVGTRRALLSKKKSGNSPQVQQFFNRLLTTPSPSRQLLYSNLINAIVTGGVWPQLDTLWVAGADLATMLTEMTSGIVATSVNGSPVFTVDRGIVCSSGSNADITTTFNPSSGGHNYSQNSAFLGAWNLTSYTPSGETDFIRTSAGTNIYLYTFTGPTAQAYMNAAAAASGSIASTLGWFSGNRLNATTQAIYQNGVLLNSASVASQAPENGTLNWWGGVANPQFAAIAFGGGLTDPQQATLYNALQTYLHAIGAV